MFKTTDKLTLHSNVISLNIQVIQNKDMLKKECCKQCRHVKFEGTMTYGH